ncbi:cardiac-enriched FHL2-interacting protein [Nycticebus coucang]|uniref:cardiac-enriched FHL2-interacting protein n=1 Tax=Nycticebus coucang TaxID=9470 RepID=UPI00234DAA89|nr:cardiac-enriched FHL2-interacting protein [Nycticebus coucang]XP_053440252.1 cardiac-enriched FHL2-interacting protein [Nycticebus coucang]XP_053440253.1 cardiac-enriched FHL2-interacting protein [Nycticebus coucang]XP_053440254.1 cardiac-enriched FHL2-interacting protein [Nycticebus coucang]XP_053440255.1 cardiac-enriched FHL2-interacting protein [Nycticebus coucang]XP_053440257.1 cardiac-enriched FHL2-interacting protein [Nycticebus coucang]XP_053440258.1 cardiac-enriched FHL2-interactin
MMQGNRKCTDGFSDSSSIGSVLDDADREVSSLTDRAFRSLCVSEDASFHDSDLALSPDTSRQMCRTLHHRKSGLWSQLPSQGTEHTGWAAALQQQPKYVQGEEKYPKSSPPLTPVQRRLEVPIAGLRSSHKPMSKVSSLIKSFDRTESRHCESRPATSKPPARKNPPNFAPLPDSSVNFCFDSAFLTVRRVPAEVSNARKGGHQPGRKHGEQESPENLGMACHSSSSFLPTPDSAASSPPHELSLGEPGRSKEWAPKGTFLHSENSAFESWNAHQPKLLERKDAETIPESKAPKHYEDMPLLRETHPPECKLSPSQAQPSFHQEENRLAPGAPSASGPWGFRDPAAQSFNMEGKAACSQPDPQVKPTQAPWRKPKTDKRGKESLQEASEEKKPTSRRGPPLYTKHNPQGQFPVNDALDMPVDPSEHYDPPFNISKLLTPVIPTKLALDSSNTQPAETTPSPPGQLNGYQEKEPSECQLRDSYKSKASSLLFNLKDVRKRVKSIYSSSPLLRGLDEKIRGKVDGKQEPISNGVVLPNELEESPPKELSKERPTDAPTASQISAQKDLMANPSESPTDSCLTPSTPPTIANTPFCVNGEAPERNSHENSNGDGESETGPARSGWYPDPREHHPRKQLSLKLCNRESEAGEATEKTKTQLENGFLRSISQETEAERQVGLQNPHLNQKFSPGPHSPEEEDVFYSDTQSDFMPGLKSKAKFSTSSSDQSFASFEDQQKTWFTESHREDRKNDLSAGDSQKDEKEMGDDEPQCCALRDGRAHVEEHSRREAVQREGESVSAGRPRKAPTEEANFRGSWVGGNRSTSLSHAKDPMPSPSSATNKHILFPIKDNTLRATPVIKPIMLPLLRTMSSEDSLGSGHREDSPRPGWGEDAGFCTLESQEMPGMLTPANTQSTHVKLMACDVTKDPGQASGTARMETSQLVPQGNFPSLPLVGEGNGMKPPPDAAHTITANGNKSSTDSGKLAAPWDIPTIALPEGDLEDQPLPWQPETCWEEQTQGFNSHFLSTPRAGPPWRRLVPGEMVTSPNSSSVGESSVCSPATSELELPSQDPQASLGPARVTRREDLTHALMREASSDPQHEPSVEDLRTLSPRGSPPDVAASSAGPPGRLEHLAQLERAAGKPPAVPPKTEKALRRAKKLASKRRKTEQVLDKQGESREGEPCPEDLDWTEQRPPSPGERPQPSFPVVRSLPPPLHRHSVSGFSELVGRQSGGPQALTPLPSYPATQKVLQDPQSGEYFVFDLPLQVKIKTFYDPETGKYVKVSVPSSERGSPEPPPPDALAAPYMLYPGFRPVPVTALMPLRCSSQLSAPTFLRQAPCTRRAARARPQSAHEAGLLPALGPQGDPAQHSADQCPQRPPQGPEEEGTEAPGLGIISTDDLEDFATEGIS